MSKQENGPNGPGPDLPDAGLLDTPDTSSLSTPLVAAADLPEPSPELPAPDVPRTIHFPEPEPTEPEPTSPGPASSERAFSDAPELAEPSELSRGASVAGHQRRESEAPESVWSSLPEVVQWDHTTPPQVVENQDVKLGLSSEPIALPSENEGLEVVGGRLPRPYPGLAKEGDGEARSGSGDGEETVVEKRTGWIHRRRNRTILAVAAVVIALIIAGIAAGVAAGVIINKNNSAAQQQEGVSNPTGAPGGGSGGGDGGGGGATGPVGPPGPAPTAPVAPTAPTGPAAPGLPTKTGFGVPTSFPEPIGGAVQSSACTGTMCPQVLAAAQYSTPGTSTMFVFARGLDSAIWYRQAENQAWKADWQSLGGNFLSQPAAVSVREGRVDVFAVWSADQSARFKTFQNGVWDEAWTNLGGSCGSPPVVCSLYPGNLNVAILDNDRTVLRKNTSDGRTWEPALFDKWESQGGKAGGSVDVACTGTLTGGFRIDMAIYGAGSTPPMLSKRWDSTASSWEKDWGHSWGLMKGDPTVVSTSDQVDYLGVGADGKVWHRSWTKADGYSKEENLGGNFQSSVSAFATGGSRLDIFAVGTDSRLKHKARLMGVWGTSWEDLGGYFHSAPKAIVTDVPTGSVSVFGVGPNGNIIHSNFEVGAGYNWGMQQWYSDGGNATSGWYRLGTT